MMKIILFISALVTLLYEASLVATAFNEIVSVKDGSANSLWGLIAFKGLNILVCLFTIAWTIS